MTKSTRSARTISACCPADALFFHHIERRAQTRGIEHVQRHAVDVDALAQHVARGARQSGHDRRLVAGQAIEQARLAGIGAPGDDDGHAFTQQPALARTLLAATSKLIAHCLQPLGECAIGEEIDFLLRKIDRGLDIGAQLDQRLGQRPAPAGKLALQRAQAARAAAREPASTRSAIASACARSSLPFR